MKKIFTTLAAVAMVAMSANAAVTVTYEGKALENGAVLDFGNDAFKYEYMSGDGWEMHQWGFEFEADVEAGNPVQAYVVATDNAMQFCANGNCFPSKQEGDLWVLDRSIPNGKFAAQIHYNIFTQNLPTAEGYMKVTLTDEDNEPFTFTLNIKTTDNSGVEEIMAGDATVAAIYDMQGRPVSEDFRGAAIVVYDNGKAVKQIIK